MARPSKATPAHASSSCSGAPPAHIGAPLADVDTPALLLDLDALDANVAAMHGQVSASGLVLRAHGKAHRCPALALRQIAAGAVGVCVQKPGEAEGFAAAGVRDILVSNEVVAPAKLIRLARLARTPQMRLAVCVDDRRQVETLAAACRAEGARIDVMIEIDVGQGRCGVQSIEAAVDLASSIAQAADVLTLRGLQAYHGRAQHLRTADERKQAIDLAARTTIAYRQALHAAGHRVSEISGGGTGSFPNEAGAGVWTELQAGSYALMDLDYRANQPDERAPVLRQAMAVLATVISRRPSHAVLDAGLKSFSVDSGLPAPRLAGWMTRDLSDEHTVLVPGEGAAALELGDQVLLDPGHCDPTAALFDWIVAVRAGRVEGVWPTLPRDASR